MHAHVASWWWGCRRRRALRAARDARCKARFALLPRARVGWHAARISLPPLPPRSRGGAREGGPAQWLTARGRRASGVAAAPRSRAAGAPAARRRRALGGARACRAFERLGGPWSAPPFTGRRRRLFSRARLPSSELGKYEYFPDGGLFLHAPIFHSETRGLFLFELLNFGEKNNLLCTSTKEKGKILTVFIQRKRLNTLR